jgi:hypothetical protein
MGPIKEHKEFSSHGGEYDPYLHSVAADRKQ